MRPIEFNKAFSMIELIFVIIIIGILAAIALPKLAATRDNALHAKLISNANICVNDLIASYKGLGNTISINSVFSCNEAIAQGASISYTADSVRVSNVDSKIDGDYAFIGTRISI